MIHRVKSISVSTMRADLMHLLRRAVFLALALFFVMVCYGSARAQDPLVELRDETLAYFKPLKGRVVSVTGKSVLTDLGEASGIRKGMRFSVLREGVPFLHPVTKEQIGKVESPAGSALVTEIGSETSHLEVRQGDVREGDIVRISEMKVPLLFYQDKTVDWSLGEHYYRLLKESGRLELIDTALDSSDDSVILAEAKSKGAQLALLLKAEGAGSDVLLMQHLLWVDDGSPVADSRTTVSGAYLKELHAGASLAPLTAAGDALLFFDLPYTGGLVASGDVNGDGTPEVLVTSGRDVRVYLVGASLQSLYEIKGEGAGEYVWIETLDVDRDGKEEIVITALGDGGAVSSVYGLTGQGFTVISKGRFFLRRLENALIGQEFLKGEGFSGPVYAVSYEKGELKKGAPLKLPGGVNIYDFVFLDGPGGTRYTLAYDDTGLVNLYTSEGLKLWTSRGDLGGFPNSFKKDAPTIMVEKGTWAVKDRLLMRNREVFAVRRIPLATTVRGLGYKSSQIKVFFWNGLSMEERTLVDGISGSILDYVLVGDRLMVLSKPLFGVKTKNILKGENPLGSMLYIYSLKGK